MFPAGAAGPARREAHGAGGLGGVGFSPGDEIGVPVAPTVGGPVSQEDAPGGPDVIGVRGVQGELGDVVQDPRTPIALDGAPPLEFPLDDGSFCPSCEAIDPSNLELGSGPFTADRRTGVGPASPVDLDWMEPIPNASPAQELCRIALNEALLAFDDAVFAPTPSERASPPHWVARVLRARAALRKVWDRCARQLPNKVMNEMGAKVTARPDSPFGERERWATPPPESEPMDEAEPEPEAGAQDDEEFGELVRRTLTEARGDPTRDAGSDAENPIPKKDEGTKWDLGRCVLWVDEEYKNIWKTALKSRSRSGRGGGKWVLYCPWGGRWRVAGEGNYEFRVSMGAGYLDLLDVEDLELGTNRLEFIDTGLAGSNLVGFRNPLTATDKRAHSGK